MQARTVEKRSLLLVLLMLAAGCSAQSPPSSPAPAPRAAEVSQRITLHTIDPSGLRDLLAQHRGRVVLVDFWATWCQPCVEWFPHSVELQRRLAARGLSVVSLSFDDPDRQAVVQDFLKRQDAELENFINRDGAAAESFEAYRIPSGLPQLQLYDRRGKLRKTFAAGALPIEERQIERAVEELLGEKL